MALTSVVLPLPLGPTSRRSRRGDAQVDAGHGHQAAEAAFDALAFKDRYGLVGRLHVAVP
jgi:hypothetical protein